VPPVSAQRLDPALRVAHTAPRAPPAPPTTASPTASQRHPPQRQTQILRAAIESPEGEIIAVYGRVDGAKAEYDVLRKTAAESKVALGKVAAVQA